MVLCQWQWAYSDVATTLQVRRQFELLYQLQCQHYYASYLIRCQSQQLYYRSEGPAQVFLLVLTWLVAAFGMKNRAEWKKIIVSYDNMCHLNNLKVSKKPLPLPGDLKHIWQDVTKIIDSLHLKNHKDPRCQQYDPKHILEPGMNTMSCEQTFAWLSRYKKILSAMPKIHHHFYLHRMVQRRNKYISRCYEQGRRPVQPRVRHVEK